MKHLRSAAAVTLGSLLACAAHAQQSGNVTIYGVFDLNIERSNHRVLGTGNTGDLTQLKSDGLFGSRLGFRGSEDLGGGNKALFVLESGIKPNTGEAGSNGRFFSRLSYLGLEGSAGRLTAGRQYTAQFDIMSPYFPLTRAPQYEPYSAIESIYTDNSLKYFTALGKLRLSAHYGFGEVANNRSASANYSAGASYEPGPWSAGLSYDQTNTAAATTGNSYGYLRRLYAAGKYQYGATTFYGGYRYAKQTAQSGLLAQRDDIAYIGVEQQFTPQINAAIGYYHQNIRSTTAASLGNPNTVAARATYALSKRTDLYAVFGHARKAGLAFAAVSTLEPGQTTQSAVALGIRHLF